MQLGVFCFAELKDCHYRETAAAAKAEVLKMRGYANNE
jgi:hypothetical protein